MGEVDVGGGVLVPAFALWSAIALAATMALRRAFAALGLYRLVWHRALFDLAIGIAVLGAVVAVATGLFGPHVR